MQLGRTPTDQELIEDALNDARRYGWPTGLGEVGREADHVGDTPELVESGLLREAVGYGWTPDEDDARSRELIEPRISGKFTRGGPTIGDLAPAVAQ